MKFFLVGTLPLFFLSISFAQQPDLVIRSGSRGLYLEHKTAPKEGFFPLSRLYNVHPRHIAAFNNHDFNKGLAIGQLVNIPLTDTNFKQSVNKGVPVYYRTTEKESLADISVKNNKVQLNNLRTWNNLSGDNAPAGSKLIIGFLITNEMQDRIVTITEKKKENVPAPAAEKKQEVVEVKKEPEIKKEEPKKTEPEIKKEDPPVIKEEPKKTTPVVVTREEKPAESEGGFFRNHFNQQVKQSPVSKEQTLTSAVFKSLNGWQDAKYYLLINGVEPGTIVKITNPGNNKVIYAKVLYAMEGIRQNEGLDMRISDAASAALAITETDKFIVKVNY